MAYNFGNKVVVILRARCLFHLARFLCLVARLCSISVRTNQQERNIFIRFRLQSGFFSYSSFSHGLLLDPAFTGAVVVVVVVVVVMVLVSVVMVDAVVVVVVVDHVVFLFFFRFTKFIYRWTGFPFPLLLCFGYVNATFGLIYLPNYIIFQHI